MFLLQQNNLRVMMNKILGGVSMRTNVNAFDYAGTICKAMKKGILLTTLNLFRKLI